MNYQTTSQKWKLMALFAYSKRYSMISFLDRRWLQCILSREFNSNIQTVLHLWDNIFSFDMNLMIDKSYHYNPTCELLDYISVTMIHKIRNELLNKEVHEVYQRLLNYHMHMPMSMSMIKNVSELVECSLTTRKLIKQKDMESIIALSNTMKKSKKKVSKIEELEGDNVTNIVNIESKSTNTSTTSSVNATHNISILEQIYLKYKNQFSLKDSREFLLIIFKLKFSNSK
jgi:hypothetical protein